MIDRSSKTPGFLAERTFLPNHFVVALRAGLGREKPAKCGQIIDSLL
jgi:hypothetical protein